MLFDIRHEEVSWRLNQLFHYTDKIMFLIYTFKKIIFILPGLLLIQLIQVTFLTISHTNARERFRGQMHYEH